MCANVLKSVARALMLYTNFPKWLLDHPKHSTIRRITRGNEMKVFTFFDAGSIFLNGIACLRGATARCKQEQNQ